MRNTILTALILGATAASVVACGSNTPEAPDNAAGAGGSETGKDYPPGPYGVSNGAVIQNHTWQGWLNPVEADYQQSALETIALADYYDPDGSKGVKAIFLNASARWCSSCKVEQSEIRNQKQEWASQGVVFIETMFEDSQSGPATFADLEAWGKTYTIDWILVLDPDNQLSLYFDAAFTPMNMVINPKDMSIKDVRTGAPDPSWFSSHFTQLVNQ